MQLPYVAEHQNGKDIQSASALIQLNEKQSTKEECTQEEESVDEQRITQHEGIQRLLYQLQ